MELLIVRHAIAHERDARRWPDDALRPLTPAGIRKFSKAALGLRRLRLRPQRVLSSSLVRARQTAELLADVAEWPQATECPELEPEGSIADLIAALRKFNVDSMAIVGHDPSLSRFIAACVSRRAGGADVRIKKGAVARLTFSRRIRVGGGRLEWLATPRLLRYVGEARS